MSACLQGVSSIVFDYTGGFTEDKLDTVFLQSLGERIKSRFVYVEGIPVNPFKKGIIKVGNKDYPEKDESYRKTAVADIVDGEIKITYREIPERRSKNEAHHYQLP